ncbi:putative phage protein [Cupriavidus necator]|uniref:Putative phage protein n=1 Tax=Cupriavidus necator TaxID=106590 RepID=A0A1K0IDX7_CUPNE|nr:putative phage protein [Cupriavidus necator]
MAGLADVSNALVALIAQIAYPNGTSQPSITGQAIKVYPGWPVPAVLTADLKAGKAHVSVFPTATEKIIDSAVSEWRELSAPATTLTLTLAGQAVTVGGTVSTPQNAALVVDGKGYVYGVQPADTLASIATALAALVAVDQPATSTGAVVTIPGAKAISPRVGGAGTSVRELRSQSRVFMVSVWANCFDARDPLADALDSALSGTFHLQLPDGMTAALRYQSSRQDDSGQKEGIYRRDLMYAVEYSTTETRTDTQITVTETNVSAGSSLDAQFPIKTIVE